jgi:hypothetical protein
MAWTLFRALLDRKIIEFKIDGPRKVHVNVSLQEEFSLNQSLSLWLLDTLALLDSQSETYALDVLTLVEAILESPDLILRKQLDRVRTEKFHELKAAGVEFDQRQEELEKLEYPKPLREFIYSTFNDFADRHPWVGHENIRPKSIAREMFETFQSFPEYIKAYELNRAEGVLLRYVSDVYRALTQTVPSQFANEDVDAIIEYFGSMIRSIDSSLLDEWEKLKNPDDPEAALVKARAIEAEHERERQVLGAEKALRIRAMNEVFRVIRSLAIGDFEEVLRILNEWGDQAWTSTMLEDRAREYAETEHGKVLTDPRARSTQFTRVKKSPEFWVISHTLTDSLDANDWEVTFKLKLRHPAVVLGHSGAIAMELVSIAPIG